MSKRRLPRFKRRLQVRFWDLEEDRQQKSGFTHNVSVEGMFICTSSPFPTGTRIGIEIFQGSERIQLYGEVRHAVRVDPVLQKIRPSGMGVRLIKVDEMMSEILRLRKAVAAETEVAAAASEAGETVSREVVAPASGGESTMETDVCVVSKHFATHKELAGSFERDIKFGGLFVQTALTPERDETVVVEFCFDWSPEEPVRVDAKVIKRFAAAEGSVDGEKVSGVGVAFTDPEDVIGSLREILDSTERDAE